MSAQYQTIGETAGRVYQALEQKGEMTLSALQKTTGVSESTLIHQAMGWLAREGKIDFQKKGKLVKVSLCCQAV